MLLAILQHSFAPRLLMVQLFTSVKSPSNVTLLVGSSPTLLKTGMPAHSASLPPASLLCFPTRQPPWFTTPHFPDFCCFCLSR